MTAGEIERYMPPLEGTIVGPCDATTAACACNLKPHADGPHVCACGGSWEWRNGEFVVHARPPLGPAMGLVVTLPIRNVFRPSGKVCYALPSGSMVHVKPGCRCSR